MPELYAQVKGWEARWQSQTSLPQRVIAVVILSATGGILAAELAAASPWGKIWEVVMFLSLVTLNAAWALRSVVSPVRGLAAHLQHLAEEASPAELRQLPTTRNDLVGEMARSARHLCLVSMRRRIEHRCLRQELDQRVRLQTRKATAKLRKLAMRDPLTNLGNRRFLDHSLRRLIARCVDQRQHLACLALDLDGFKAVNDALGHEAGDRLLKDLGQTLRSHIRENDFAARCGGDEFVVLLVGADHEAAKARSEQIRDAFARQSIERLEGTGLKTGVSIGVSSLGDDRCMSVPHLLRQADRRLYQDKSLRRAA